jgi:hypothetical protein
VRPVVGLVEGDEEQARRDALQILHRQPEGEGIVPRAVVQISGLHLQFVQLGHARIARRQRGSLVACVDEDIAAAAFGDVVKHIP